MNKQNKIIKFSIKVETQKLNYLIQMNYFKDKKQLK